MKTLHESILDDEDILIDKVSSKEFINKSLAQKFASVHKTVKYIEKRGKDIIRRDMYGQELNVGDLVFVDGAFVTAPVQVLVITEFTKLKKGKNDGCEIMCYNPYTDKIERQIVQAVVKIQNPEKYLKK